jgi:hypothetical protein
MAKRDKTTSIPASSLRGDIPAEVIAKLQAAYQASGPSSILKCPDPESVIDYAFEELTPEKRSAVQAHLSECKECLALVLDLRSAWAEAERGEYIVRESAPIHVQSQSWLAGLADGMRGLFPYLFPVRRLIPVAVALVVLAVAGLGVFQHLTVSTSGQLPFTMTQVKPSPAYNYQVHAIVQADEVSPAACAKRRTNMAFLPLLLNN